MLFSQEIIHWYQVNKRELPWRNTRDPYTIWLSEVILQQTRVAQGLPYFQKFLDGFPDVLSLAHADESIILRHWQGLGYYSRARNMHKTAKIIADQYNGIFPSDYDTLIKLPGIGDYTASAIASFAANACHPVVDGNVYRVLSRYFGLSEAINSPKGKATFSVLAHTLLPKDYPAEYNQAIMEFGALQCIPRSPICIACPLQIDCHAYQTQTVDQLPVKIKAAPKKDRYFHYFLISNADQLMVQKRTDNDIWQNLYELPLLESEELIKPEELSKRLDFQQVHGSDCRILSHSRLYKQVLSHQNIHARFYELQNSAIDMNKKADRNYVFIKELDNLAKPKLMISFFSEYYSGTF